MWKLQPLESEGEPFYLLPCKEYVVGRKNCDILLPNDQSISRAHAQVTVSGETLTLRDTSKYGTFVNEEQLAGGTTKTIQAGDRVTFGVFQSKFKVERECIVVCSSCLDDERKKSLTETLSTLGGRLVNSWTEACTHLVMPSVKVTIKMICALLCCRPIVKEEFFTELCKALQLKQTPPKPQRFFPEIAEPSLTIEDVDLGPQTKRKNVFDGKIFVFLNSKQMKRLSQAVGLGGGRSQLLEEGSLPLSLLESSGTCVIDMTTGNSQALVPASARKWVESILQILNRKGMRFITESEIGLSAIYASSKTYCNPCSKTETESTKIKPELPEATLSQNAPVEETVLPAASQNITAYVVNTGPSQDVSRMDISRVSAVGETPEKQPRQVGSSRSMTSAAKQPMAGESSTAHAVEGGVTSSVTAGKGNPVQQRTKEWTQQDDSAKLKPPKSKIESLKASPSKQSSLTSFFQPLSKKRAREDSVSPDQSQSKLSRQIRMEEEEDSVPSFAVSVNKAHSANTHTAPTQRSGLGFDFSSSLGLGPGLGSSSLGRSDGLSKRVHQNQEQWQQRKASTESGPVGVGTKRKEPIRDSRTDHDKIVMDDDLGLSLEELESIMSEDMDVNEPQGPAANKKQRLGQEDGGATSRNQGKGAMVERKRVEEKSANPVLTNLNLEQPARNLEKRSMVHSDLCSSSVEGNTADKNRTENGMEHKRPQAIPVASIKEEEVSLVEDSTQTSKPDGNAELPRRLIQIQFKSLTISKTANVQPRPLQTLNPNTKNFKKFRKAQVPGANAMPTIIGGSDLVAHNRSKNSELQEWLREAAEEGKQNEREETLGDDLFRYNPKPTKKR